MVDQQPVLSSISAVFPAYNDGGTIASMVTTAYLVLEEICEDFEIIVVDDGSLDYTPSVLDALPEHFQNLKIIHHERNMGYGRTIRDGFALAQKDWVFYTDGDAQYNPMELKDLAMLASDQVDVINGYKISRHDPIIRKWIGKLYHLFVSRIFKINIMDTNCDFRLIRKSALENISLVSNNGSLGLELVKKLQIHGYRFIEVPVNHYPRAYGVSQFFNPKYLYRTAIEIIQLWQYFRNIQSENG